MSQLLHDKVAGPTGKFEVSTVWTYAGGAPEERPFASPFSTADYAEETPWPFETMVFQKGSSKGLYHRAYASENEARSGHAEVVALCQAGTLPIGDGVTGEFGHPSLTAAEWAARAPPPARRRGPHA